MISDMTGTLTQEQARRLAWDEADPEWGLTVEFNEQVDSGRWESIHQLVIKDREGRYWEAHYTRGLTEYQESKPFEGHALVEFREVEKVPVTTYEYRPLPAVEACASPILPED
jgi:hypothetical protein